MKIFDHVFLMRPVLFIPGWATLLAGHTMARKSDSAIAVLFYPKSELVLWNPGLFTTILAFTFAMGGSFVLNQICDIDSDRVNNKLFLIGNHTVSIRAGIILAVFLLAFSSIISFFINNYVFFSILLFIILTAFLYNVAPFALKNKPWWGLFANVLMGWLAFASGWLSVSTKPIDLFVTSLPFVFYNTGLYFLTLLPDMAGDSASNKDTFAVRYGEQTALWTGLLFFAFTLFVSVALHNQFMIVVCLMNVPFWIRLIFHRTIEYAFTTCKIGITIFALSVCFYYPFFFVSLALVFVASRYYYKKRFNLQYPTLSEL